MFFVNKIKKSATSKEIADICYFLYFYYMIIILHNKSFVNNLACKNLNKYLLCLFSITPTVLVLANTEEKSYRLDKGSLTVLYSA